jgi:hypothetical protein
MRTLFPLPRNAHSPSSFVSSFPYPPIPSSPTSLLILFRVVAFTRISLPSILSLQKGPYVTSPLQEVGQDETENFGFKIAFHAEESDSRITSYSVDNAVSAPSTPSVLVEGERKDLGAATAGAEVEEGTNRRRSGGLKPLFTASSSSPAKDKEASPALTPTPEPDFFVFKVRHVLVLPFRSCPPLY